MALGVLGVIFGPIPAVFWIGGTLGLLAVIFGAIGRGRAKRGEATNRKVATFGLGLGIAAMVASFFGMLFSILIVGEAANEAAKEIDKGLAPYNAQEAKDVSISDCRVVPGKFVKATVKVHNPTNHQHDYDGTIAVSNPDNPKDRYGSIVWLTDLSGGQTTTLKGFEAEGNVNNPSVPIGPADCKLTQVDRW